MFISIKTSSKESCINAWRAGVGKVSLTNASYDSRGCINPVNGFLDTASHVPKSNPFEHQVKIWEK